MLKGVLFGGTELVRVDPDEGEEGVGTSSTEIVPHDINEGGLHEDCFENDECLFAKSCGHEVSKGGETGEGAARDGALEGVAEVIEGDLLLEDVCGLL